MNLPPNVACNLLQQHVNAAITQQLNVKTVIQNDGPMEEDAPSTSQSIPFTFKRVKAKRAAPRQMDGPADSSEEEDDVSDDDDVSDEPEDDKDDEDPEMEAEGPEEEPLNSEDDVSEEDPSELFDTENVVVCQYDKVNTKKYSVLKHTQQ